MSTLQHRQQKIQEKRKKTPWRDFVMEIGSWGALNLYKHQGMISIYPPTQRIPKNIVDMKMFQEQVDTLTDFGITRSGDFFKDIIRLKNKIPLPVLRNLYAENSEHCGNVRHANNSYLSFAIVESENILYSFHVKEHSRNVLSSTTVRDTCENIYSSHSILRSQSIFYSRNIVDGYENWFCVNMLGCQHCLFCDGLQNQSYCISNKQYSKEEYMQKKEEFLSHKDKFPQRAEYTFKQGDYFSFQVEDIENGRNTYRLQHARNVINAGSVQGNEYIYDLIMGGSPSGSHMYGNIYIGPGEHIYCSDYIAGNQNIYYSYFLDSCSYCLGCIGLKNKSYCILNKQYTKEEWHQKVDEIFQKMENTPLLTSPPDGIGTPDSRQGEEKRDINGDIVTELGSFFPGWMNPYYFNDTVAYMIDDSFTKEEVEAEGYLWRDEEVRVDIPENVDVVSIHDLGTYEGWSQTPPPDFVGDLPLSGEPLDALSRFINPEILKKVIQDEQGNVYRIVEMEYDFLMKYGLPLPRLHWLDRLKQNFKIS